VFILVPTLPLALLSVLPHPLLDICRNLLAVARRARRHGDLLLDTVGVTLQRLEVIRAFGPAAKEIIRVTFVPPRLLTPIRPLSLGLQDVPYGLRPKAAARTYDIVDEPLEVFVTTKH
jgi:hypothetical protein